MAWQSHRYTDELRSNSAPRLATTIAVRKPSLDASKGLAFEWCPFDDSLLRSMPRLRVYYNMIVVVAGKLFTRANLESIRT
jgi:hypothetical protein